MRRANQLMCMNLNEALRIPMHIESASSTFQHFPNSQGGKACLLCLLELGNESSSLSFASASPSASLPSSAGDEPLECLLRFVLKPYLHEECASHYFAVSIQHPKELQLHSRCIPPSLEDDSEAEWLGKMLSPLGYD